MVQFGVVPAAYLAVHESLFGNDISLQPTVDAADVGCGLGVDTSQRKLGQDLGSDQDGRQAFLRLHARVGGNAPDVGRHHVLRGRGDGDSIDRAFPVKDHAGFRGDLRELEIVYAHQAPFFSAGKGHFDGPVAGAGVYH